MPTLRQRVLPQGAQVQLVQGDITAQRVDAIVNAANRHLAHGGGVAAVIARKGGPIVEEQSRAWVRQHGPITHETPAVTACGNLPCRYIIHVVGPVWHGGRDDEAAKLRTAVQAALQRAADLGLGSLALPAISTGIYGYPKTQAARVILQAIADHFTAQPRSPLTDVRVVLYDQPTTAAFLAVWDEMYLQP